MTWPRQLIVYGALGTFVFAGLIGLNDNPEIVTRHLDPRFHRAAEAVIYLAATAFRWGVAFFGVLISIALIVFLFPAALVGYYVFLPYTAFLRRYLGEDSTGFFWAIGAVLGLTGAFAILVFAFLVSWVWWSTLIPRVLSLLGLWNPFWAADSRPKRWMLRAFVNFRNWRESLRFGKGASAGWAGFWEVLAHGYRTGDIFLGRPKLFIGGMMRPIGISTETHMVTIAAPGSGKSTGAMVPNLCLHTGSVLCIDPAGELAATTAYFRAMRYGQKVAVVDPYGIVHNHEKSACYNVFDELARVAEENPDSPVGYAGRIADALVKDVSSKEPFWDNSAKTLLRGLVLYIFAQEPEENRHLGRLRQLLLEGDYEAYQTAVEEGVIDSGDRDMTPFHVLLEKMKLARSGPYGGTIAGTAYNLERMSPNQMGGVISTAQEHTSFLDSPELQKISKRSDFLLSDLKGSPLSVYLCLPLNALKGKEGSWLRMFVMLLVDMMGKGRAVPPILLAIDEFPNLGKLDGIETVAPTLRKHGVRLWAVGQDYGQFEAVYGEYTARTLIGSAEAVQFMGITEPKTVKYLADLLGQHEVVVDKWNDGRNTRQVKAEKPLLDADQVKRFLDKDRKNQIIWRGRKKPLRLKVTPYYDYMPWWYYDRDPRHREKFKRAFWRWRFWAFKSRRYVAKLEKKVENLETV